VEPWTYDSPNRKNEGQTVKTEAAKGRGADFSKIEVDFSKPHSFPFTDFFPSKLFSSKGTTPWQASKANQAGHDQTQVGHGLGQADQKHHSKQ
jgi:hypothetical protein